jgi:hypothetical protein
MSATGNVGNVESETIQLFDDESLCIAVKKQPISYEELITLLRETASLTKDFFTKKLKNKDQPLSDFRHGYDKGLKAASLIFSSDPEISSLIKTALTRRHIQKVQFKSTPNYPPFDIPRYNQMIRTMLSLKDNRERTLGTVNGESVLFAVIGHVPTTYEDDSDFSDKCMITIGKEYNVDAYCLGCIEYTGTGILVAEDDRVFAYSVPLAVNEPWKVMGGSNGAEVFVDAEGEITLKPIPELHVESLDGF